MIEYVSDLRLFLAISRTLNFREAGESLGYSPAVVTTRMQRLEAVTGKTLFIRSTRHIKMTEEGHQLMSLAEQVLELTEQMGRQSRGTPEAGELKGMVRITSPHSFARLFLVTPIQQLMNQHPELTIDLILEDNLSKLVKEGIDISFRVGGNGEPNTDRHDLFCDRRILIASPAYLKEKGTPASGQDLKHHTCLAYSNTRQWTLVKDNRPCQVSVRSALWCNTGDFLSRLVQSGSGITVKSQWSVQEELDNGQLVRVLPEYTAGNDQTVMALLPHREYVPTRITYVLERIRAFIDETISEELKLG